MSRLSGHSHTKASVSGVLVVYWGWALDGHTAEVHTTHSLQAGQSQGRASRGAPMKLDLAETPSYLSLCLCLLQDLPYLAGSAFLSSSPAAKDRAQGTEQRCADPAYTHLSRRPFSPGNDNEFRNSQGTTEKTKQQGGRSVARDACGLAQHLGTPRPVLPHNRCVTRSCSLLPGRSGGRSPGNKQ